MSGLIQWVSWIAGKDQGGSVSDRTPGTADASSEITLRIRSRYFCDKKPATLNFFTI